MRQRLLAVGVGLFVSISLQAQQWSEPDATSFATTRKVGIGMSTAPAKQLEVIGEAAFSSFLTAGEVVVKPSAGLGRGRVHMTSSQWVALTLNSRVAAQWELDDTTVAGWAAKLDGRSGWDQFAIMRIPAGPNPHTDEKVLFQVHGNGNIGMGLNVGVVAEQPLHVFRNADEQSFVYINNPFVGTNALAAFRAKSDTATTNFVAHSSARTLTRWGVPLGGWAEILQVDGNGQIIGTNAARPLILGTAATNRLHISGDGNIGINTPAPADGLHLLNKNVLVQAEAPVGTASHAHIGIGAKAANGGLHYYRWYVSGSAGGSGLVPNAMELYEYPAGDAAGCCKQRILIRPSIGVATQPLVLDGRGWLGLGGTLGPAYPLDVTGAARVRGDMIVDGNIGAKYQDLAEWVPATEDLTPGTVVVLNPASINEVMPSARAYDTRVAGVVSEMPGIILGEAGAKKEQIATTGRVKVRVDATKGAIAVGDLLVTSDVPGMAMKSQPLDLGGVAIHRPGTIVGKALEPLANGTGEILVLLSLQ